MPAEAAAKVVHIIFGEAEAVALVGPTRPLDPQAQMVLTALWHRSQELPMAAAVAVALLQVIVAQAALGAGEAVHRATARVLVVPMALAVAVAVAVSPV